MEIRSPLKDRIAARLEVLFEEHFWKFLVIWVTAIFITLTLLSGCSVLCPDQRDAQKCSNIHEALNWISIVPGH